MFQTFARINFRGCRRLIKRSNFINFAVHGKPEISNKGNQNTCYNKIDTFLLITNHKPSSNAPNSFPSSSILVLSNHQNHHQVPILSWSHPHFPRFSRENNQVLLERGSINSGFRVNGEIRSESIYPTVSWSHLTFLDFLAKIIKFF